MSADAASLPCPICYHTGGFDSVHSLRDRLIYVSTNKLLCPVCQEEVTGLDKLTIHLFSHVKLLTTKGCLEKVETINTKIMEKTENQVKPAMQKKSRPTVSKNKPSLPTVSPPVKYVKIYPKLPVLSPFSIIDISQKPQEGSSFILNVKSETKLIQTNTTCSMCGLQFIDVDILRMHKCLIHNIEENSNKNITRHHCHLCLKNFKMRGSLMVHLRVAHYGFSSVSETTDDKSTKGQNHLLPLDDKTVERNENKQWQCDVCRKCFTTKYFLKKHKRLHTGETPYACSQCNKTFTFQQSYHKHLLYHNDEKPHTCTYCGRAFKELSTLHNHQRIHTGEKPFSCETCGKCFRQRVSYLVHRRIHTGVMPYKCTSCEKSFRYKVSQRTHKCLAQPPGTVVRQAGELVEKLKKKHAESRPSYGNSYQLIEHVNYPEVSEANAELVRSGAKLSLEDMESDNFTLIAEVFNDSSCNSEPTNSIINKVERNTTGANDSNIESLIDSIPVVDKNIPSPSEILKNLCLSKEEDFSDIFQGENDEKNYDICKELNSYL